ncbi:reverse transcriptase domain-containing protein [Tanacetum coccineum]
MPVDKTNKFSCKSTGVASSSSVRRSESKDNNLKKRVLRNTKRTFMDVKKSQRWSSASLAIQYSESQRRSHAYEFFPLLLVGPQKWWVDRLAQEYHYWVLLKKALSKVTADQETSGLNKLHGVSFISGPESDTPEVLQHQLPPKELNPGSFTLPCTIGNSNFYAMDNLGASINVIPRSIFEHLHLTNLKKTNMLGEMADMSKKAPLGIVENVLVKIDKFLFPSDFVIIDNTPSETTIFLGNLIGYHSCRIDVSMEKYPGINENIGYALINEKRS